MVIRDLDISHNVINKSFSDYVSKRNHMIEDRQRRSVLIKMPKLFILVYVGFSSQPILNEKEIKLYGWSGESK